MALERLEFEGSDACYQPYAASQHLVRYATVKEFVKGKRVLDVACGAGYGVALLSNWGAKEVVGVDIADSAIDSARRLFGGAGRSFIQGDVELLGEVLKNLGGFDVIVSFETIEHLAQPDRLLIELPKLLNPDGLIAISCPNDAAYYAVEKGNQFHLKRFSFGEFKNLCELHLGPARQWFFGAPVQGELNYIAGSPQVESGHVDAASIVLAENLGGALLLPSGLDLQVSAETCSHFLGFWGSVTRSNVVVSAQSVPSYREPWLALDWLRARIAELEKVKADYFEPELSRLGAILESQEQTKREWFEPELERLDRELQHQRARVMYYTDQISILSNQIDPLRAKVEELESLKPENEHMRKLVEEYEAVKQEWFVPQLEQHQQRVAELKDYIASIDDFKSSITYRTWRKVRGVLGLNSH